MNTDKAVKSYLRIYKKALTNSGLDNIEERASAYSKRLTEMYASDKFRQHDRYPTINVVHVYAVIAMCLELKEAGLTDSRIIEVINYGFEKRRSFFAGLIKIIDIMPNSFEIAKRWNINDHKKRVNDSSITYDRFEVTRDRVEYSISKCMYVEMFKSYGVRGLCKIFCMTDETAYAGLNRHVKFVRHSDLSDGDSCCDEVIRR